MNKPSAADIDVYLHITISEQCTKPDTFVTPSLLHLTSGDINSVEYYSQASLVPPEFEVDLSNCP